MYNKLLIISFFCRNFASKCTSTYTYKKCT